MKQFFCAAPDPGSCNWYTNLVWPGFPGTQNLSVYLVKLRPFRSIAVNYCPKLIYNEM